MNGCWDAEILNQSHAKYNEKESYITGRFFSGDVSFLMLSILHESMFIDTRNVVVLVNMRT